MDKVSVIIPNYNHSLYLKQRIDSVLEQSYPNIEVILLDDCSTDTSRDLMSAYSHHPNIAHIVFNDQNSGSTFKQWQKGIALATGNYIWIAESDDVADPQFLDTALKAFAQNPSLGLVQTQSYHYTADNKVLEVFPTYGTPYKWDQDFEANGKTFIQQAMMLNNALINASAILFKKQALEVACLDSSFKLNGDWLLYLSILLKYDFYHIGKPLNYFRQHNNKGSSKNVENSNNLKEYARIITYLYANLPLSDSQKDTLRFVFVQKWLAQNDNSLPRLLSNHFASIAKLAIVNDKFFLGRLLKLY